MNDLTEFNRVSLQAMQLIFNHLPKSEAAKVAAYLEQGLRLKLSTIVGDKPDVTMTLVNDLEQEILIYSLLGRAGETVQ
jgi:hypothetical protein